MGRYRDERREPVGGAGADTGGSLVAGVRGGAGGRDAGRRVTFAASLLTSLLAPRLVSILPRNAPNRYDRDTPLAATCQLARLAQPMLWFYTRLPPKRGVQ